MIAPPTAVRVLPIVLGLAACKPTGEAQPPEAAPGGASTPASEDATPEDAADETPRCAADGTPWDGKPTGCFYEHGGCCYPSPEALCAAAGCNPAGCVIMESSPAQARCDDADPVSRAGSGTGRARAPAPSRRS